MAPVIDVHHHSFAPAVNAARLLPRARGGGVMTIVAAGVDLDFDVLEISVGQWAVHGHLAYEGEVIAATFASASEAWSALAATISLAPSSRAVDRSRLTRRSV